VQRVVALVCSSLTPCGRVRLSEHAERLVACGTGNTLAMEQDAAVADLAALFRATLLTMHECRVSEGGSPGRWNRLVNEMQSMHLRLRETEEGRRAITALVEDECLTVRQWAATNALAWSPEIARAELERQASADGLGSFDAQMTLREFDADRLDTAWQPRR